MIKHNSRPTHCIVVGLGNVGLYQALEAALVGYSVIGVEIDRYKLDCLSAGRSYVSDISDAEISTALASGQLSVTDCIPPNTGESRAIVVSVDTPYKNGTISYDSLRQALSSIFERASSGDLVIVRSCVMPHVVEELLLTPLERRGKTGILVGVAPERMNVGSRTLNDPALPRVVGGVGEDATDATVRFFTAYAAPTHIFGWKEALLAKILENVYRYVNISLINEFAQICDHQGIDANRVVDAASTKPFGYAPFRPNKFVGGQVTLTPAIQWKQSLATESHSIVATALAQNDRVLMETSLRIRETLFQYTQKNKHLAPVLVGVGYKRGYGDPTHSRNGLLGQYLADAGYSVRYWDPWVSRYLINGAVVERVARLESLDHRRSVLIVDPAYREDIAECLGADRMAEFITIS